jgi:signal transduction histidine kinase
MVGIPLLAAAVGVITWFLTGRALRPVEEIRAEAERISGTDLDRRLPLPGTADEIRALAETLNRMLDRLEGSATEMRRFVADASHELKSPLASLLAMVEITRRHSDDAELRRLMDDLEVEIDRMQRLVGDLLLLARYDEARPPLDRRDVDVDELVLAEAGAMRRRDTVVVDTSATAPVRVRGDRHGLERLVRNLVDNAARHAATTVWLGTSEEGGVAVLSVSDDGPGIAVADRHRVFERFVRLDDSRARATGGTGLGLAVVRAIARGHGGDASAVEPRHGGATFEVRIPVDGDVPDRGRI